MYKKNYKVLARKNSIKDQSVFCSKEEKALRAKTKQLIEDTMKSVCIDKDRIRATS